LLNQQKIRTIEEIKQRIFALREEDKKLNAESGELAEKRNKLNDKFRSLRLEILAFKNTRDKLNEKVKELKQQRDNAKIRVQAIVKDSNELKQKIEILNNKKPMKGRQILQKELDDIEWKIQTTPLSLQEEKKFIEKVKQIENQLNTYKKLVQLNLELNKSQAELRALKTKIDDYHKEMTETAKKSREAHAKMLEKIDESKKVKADADRLHALYLETREKTKHQRKEIAEMSSQMRKLEEEIREEEAKERAKEEEVLRGKLEKEVREKLKRGEKLSWEEFQLLAEEQKRTQD
jgi:uncharacterized coiled-coil DUF342 family protein